MNERETPEYRTDMITRNKCFQSAVVNQATVTHDANATTQHKMR